MGNRNSSHLSVADFCVKFHWISASVALSSAHRTHRAPEKWVGRVIFRTEKFRPQTRKHAQSLHSSIQLHNRLVEVIVAVSSHQNAARLADAFPHASCPPTALRSSVELTIPVLKFPRSSPQLPVFDPLPSRHDGSRRGSGASQEAWCRCQNW